MAVSMGCTYEFYISTPPPKILYGATPESFLLTPNCLLWMCPWVVGWKGNMCFYCVKSVTPETALDLAASYREKEARSLHVLGVYTNPFWKIDICIDLHIHTYMYVFAYICTQGGYNVVLSFLSYNLYFDKCSSALTNFNTFFQS